MHEVAEKEMPGLGRGGSLLRLVQTRFEEHDHPVDPELQADLKYKVGVRPHSKG